MKRVDRDALLEEIARDETVAASTRVRALEALGRGETAGATRRGRAVEEPTVDPMNDLDELTARRRRRVA